jgi:hypothetical protein
MRVVGFPNDSIPSGASAALSAHLPIDCNRISLRGSRHFIVTKLVVGKDVDVYSGAGIGGDVLVHGIRVYEGADLRAGMTAEITIVNVDRQARPAEIYMTLRRR